MCSRRKICSKVLLTEVVPAPEEPVTAMIGWRADMAIASSDVLREEPARGEQRHVELEFVVVAVVALDALDLRARAEHEANALMQALGNHIEDRPMPGARAPSGLLDEVADRIGLVEQPQPPRPGRLLAVARI